MSGSIEAFIIKAFSYLVDEFYFDADTFKNGEHTWWSQAVAVSVCFERREFYPFVKLSRVRRGEILRNPGEVVPSSVLSAFDLDDLIALRAPSDRLPPHDVKRRWDEAYATEMITHQARCLHAYGADILRGDLSCFSELERRVKERARKMAFEKWGEQARLHGWT